MTKPKALRTLGNLVYDLLGKVESYRKDVGDLLRLCKEIVSQLTDVKEKMRVCYGLALSFSNIQKWQVITNDRLTAIEGKQNDMLSGRVILRIESLEEKTEEILDRLKALEEWKVNSLDCEQRRHASSLEIISKENLPELSGRLGVLETDVHNLEAIGHIRHDCVKSILDRLKALEEWKLAETNIVLEAINKNKRAGESVPRQPVEPLKLPCTTCKHRVKAFKLDGGLFSGITWTPESDTCGIAIKPHICEGPKHKYCARVNRDQLCKFHSERNK